MEGFSAVDPQAYGVFCANQKHANTLYQEKKRTSPAFAACIQKCEAHPGVDRLCFTDYLAKPLQRLTKYPLLLKGILQNTKATDTHEVSRLVEAVEKAENVLRYVQEKVCETEDRTRLKELHEKLDITGLSNDQLVVVRHLHLSGRSLIAEAPLQIRSGDKLFDIRLLLLSDMLLITLSKDDRQVVRVSCGLGEGDGFQKIRQWLMVDIFFSFFLLIRA